VRWSSSEILRLSFSSIHAHLLCGSLELVAVLLDGPKLVPELHELLVKLEGVLLGRKVIDRLGDGSGGVGGGIGSGRG
jgi:hypothetical protein